VLPNFKAAFVIDSINGHSGTFVCESSDAARDWVVSEAGLEPSPDAVMGLNDHGTSVVSWGVPAHGVPATDYHQGAHADKE
jgi:hypothetical protein